MIIPALDEADTVASVIRGIPASVRGEVIVVDGGSHDGTAKRARAAGATVLVEPRRGYGRACSTGVRRAIRGGAEIVAFLDAAGAEDPRDLPGVIGPIARDEADLIIGSRELGHCEPGALRLAQRAGNRLATWLIWRLHGHRYSDLGSMRAIRVDALERLDMQEFGSGWPVEMQLKAVKLGLRVDESPIRYRRRRSGRSKVSGTVLGAVRAGTDILRVVLGSARE